MTSGELLTKGLVLEETVSKNSDPGPYLRESSNWGKYGLTEAFLYWSHALVGSSSALYPVIALGAHLAEIGAVTEEDFNVNFIRDWNRILEAGAKAARKSRNQASIERNDIKKLCLITRFSTRSVSSRAEAWTEM